MTEKMSEKKVSSISYEIETTILATPERVWRALTQEIGDWWLPDFHMVAPDSTVELQLRPGGQLIEYHPDAGGLSWYTIQMYVPGKSLDLLGHLTPEFGGPALSMLSWKLSEEGGNCKLTVLDALLGCVSAKGVNQTKQGWSQLINDGLKRYVESNQG